MQTLLENLREKIKALLMQDHNMLLLAAVIGFLAGLAISVEGLRGQGLRVLGRHASPLEAVAHLDVGLGHI